MSSIDEILDGKRPSLSKTPEKDSVFLDLKDPLSFVAAISFLEMKRFEYRDIVDKIGVNSRTRTISYGCSISGLILSVNFPWFGLAIPAGLALAYIQDKRDEKLEEPIERIRTEIILGEFIISKYSTKAKKDEYVMVDNDGIYDFVIFHEQEKRKVICRFEEGEDLNYKDLENMSPFTPITARYTPGFAALTDKLKLYRRVLNKKEEVIAQYDISKLEKNSIPLKRLIPILK
tara:strand:+ start:265 stop:960 length:696 start_codon:yes stop_codon:yes gene_type:complete